MISGFSAFCKSNIFTSPICLASISSGRLLGEDIGTLIADTKKSMGLSNIEEKKRYKTYINLAVGSIASVIFAAAVSHKLVNTLSLGKTVLAQVGIAAISFLIIESPISKNFPPEVKKMLTISGGHCFNNGLTLTAIIAFKHFGFIAPISEEAKNLVFIVTLISAVASGIFHFFFPTPLERIGDSSEADDALPLHPSINP